MIKRLTKILITGLFALVLAFGATGIIKPVELKAASSIPSGYTRVDYIQATAGAAYIDTGAIVNYNNNVTFSGIMSSATASGTPIIWGDARSQEFLNNGVYVFWSISASATFSTTLSSALDNVCVFSFTSQKNITPIGVFNGVNVTSSGTTPSTVSNENAVHLFGRYQANQPNSHLNSGTTVRFYSFSIYDNTSGAYLCDLIPVIRNSDDAVGMYDRVSNTFKGNANSSGTFTYGKKLSVPSGYTEVPYLEQDTITDQSGYAWTNTGVIGQAKQIVFGDIENLQYSADYGIATFAGVVSANNGTAYTVDYFNNQAQNVNSFRLLTRNPSSYRLSFSNEAFTLNTKHSFITYADTSRISTYMKGIIGSANSYWDNTLVTNLPFYTFGHNANGSYAMFRRSHTRIYNLGFLSDSGVTGYLIPCIRNSDGALGFYNAVNDTFYANQGTVPFTTDGTIYVVNSASDFTNALNNAVSGDYVIIANDVTIAQQDFAFASGVNIIQNDHTITPPTVTGYGIHSYWYTNSSYTGYTTDAIFSGIHYYAKYLTEIAVSTLQELESALTTATANDVIVLTADIQYTSETFTNTSQAVINNISHLKPSVRTTPWSFNDWYGNGWINNNPIEPNKYLQAGYIASITDETRLDIALETATYLDKISLVNDITLTSNSANHPYGNVTGSSFTTKTFNTFNLNSHTISSNAHPNWSIGYAFDDWYSTKWTTALNGAAPSQNTTYYARYEITANSGQNLNFAFSQSLDGDIITLGSDVTMPNEAFSIPANVTFNQNGKTITPPTKSYYTILGWGENGGSSTVSTFTPGNVYNALYTPDTFPIVYATQTGITYTLPDDAPTSYTYGIGTSLPIPTRDGYSFAGWYGNAQLTGNIINSISTTDYGQKTLFSSWQEKPTSISIGNINVFRNVGDGTTGKGENDDMFVLFTYNISWNNTPTVNVNQWFTFRLMDTDGTTTLATFNPYPYNDYGYGLGVGYFYIPDMVASNITWNEEYQIRIDANPFAWYSITGLTTTRNIYSGNYTNKTSQDDNRRLLTAAITNIAHQLENNWFVGESIPYMLISQENNVAHFTSYGMTYFENSIANLRIFTPDLFLSNVIIPDYSEDKNPENADPASLITRWQTQYEGTWLQDAFEGFGGLFHMPWRMVTSIMCLVIWIILAAVSARMFGNTDAGFWAGSVVFATGVSMGIMEYTIIGAGALLIVFYSLYILFWRQG